LIKIKRKGRKGEWRKGGKVEKGGTEEGEEGGKGAAASVSMR
jgi:hypothetical protein